ncbi:hypothetical protein MMR65_25335, partial [Escherichia coli]|nr:hypothetical protein [Escherichia coli]
WEGWVISLRQKQKKLIMLPSETMIWQPEFTDKTLSRKTGAVQGRSSALACVATTSFTGPSRRLPCAVSVLNAIYGYPFSASGCKDDHSTSAKFRNALLCNSLILRRI